MSLADMFITSKDTDTHRVCGTCTQRKPVECFYRDGRDKNGNIRYRRDCRECYKKTRLLEARQKGGYKHVKK